MASGGGPAATSDEALAVLRDQVKAQDYRAFIRASEEIARVEGRVAQAKQLLYAAEDSLVTLENIALDLGESAAFRGGGFGPGSIDAPYDAGGADDLDYPNAFGGGAGGGGGGGNTGGLRLPQWLEAAPDELEEYILERHNKAAEELIRKVRQFEAQIWDPSSVSESLREVFEKVRKGAHALATRLLKEVRVGANRGSQVWGFRAQEQNFRLLIALGYGEAAARTFLSNRKKDSRRVLNVVDVGGDFSAYVQVLCRAFASVIREATVEFFSLFSDGGDHVKFSHRAAPSQHMAWVDTEVEFFCDTIGGKLFSTLVAMPQANPGSGGGGAPSGSPGAAHPTSPTGRDSSSAAPLLLRAHTVTRADSFDGPGPASLLMASPGSIDEGEDFLLDRSRTLNPLKLSPGLTRDPARADGAARRRRATAAMRRRSMLSGASGAGEAGQKSQAEALRKALLALEMNLRPLAELGLLLWPRVGMLLLPHLREFFEYRVSGIVTAMDSAMRLETWQVYDATLAMVPSDLSGAFRVEDASVFSATGKFLRSTEKLVRYIYRFLQMASRVLDLSDEAASGSLVSQPLSPLIDDVISCVLHVLRDYVRRLEDAVIHATPEHAEAVRSGVADGVDALKTKVLPLYAKYKDSRQTERLARAIKLEGFSDGGARSCSFESVQGKVDQLTRFLGRELEI